MCAVFRRQTTKQYLIANHHFTTALYRQIAANREGNFIAGPATLGFLFGLIQTAARDETGVEIRKGFGFPFPPIKIEHGVTALLPLLNKDDLYTLKEGNKIYYKNTFEIREEFKKAAQAFGTELESIDFRLGSAPGVVNGWVEERTQGQVINLISGEDLNEQMRAICVSVVRFKGKWARHFQVHHTRKQNFYRRGTELIKVDTLEDTTYHGYYESRHLHCKFVKLAFESGDVTFHVVLPDERTGLALIEAQLETLYEIPYRRQCVRVVLPKFKLEDVINVKAMLEKLGVNKVFSAEGDLSGIAGERGDFVIDKVFQKNIIDLNELGVQHEPPAPLRAGVPLPGSSKPQPIQFIAEHPFVFFLKHGNLVVFAGRIVDPESVQCNN